jgi:hypothetical protein
MAMSLSTDVRTARVNTIRLAIDSGGAAASLRIYDGARPSVAGAEITSQNLLATLTFSYPCETSVSGGILVLAEIAPVTASQTGTATWARITDSAGVFVADLDVSVAGGGGQIILNTVNLVASGNVEITSAIITDGNT